MRNHSFCRRRCVPLFVLALFTGLISAVAIDESGDFGTVHGTVTIKDNGTPVHAASVTIVQLGRSTMTDSNGRYEFLRVPHGTYDIISHMHALTDENQLISVKPGLAVTADFHLSISPIRHEITVTASGREETRFDTFQVTTTLDTLDLSEQSAFGLGDVVGKETGVNKRSFGPGSSRPVIRGFDGDRVLVLVDGMPTGTLSSQSGEHAEPIDAAHMDRVEIVKGPATLLYGSNAIGGVVNAVTEHHLLHEHPHEGLRGQLTTIGGSNNNQAAGHVNAEYGLKNWLFWGSGSRQVTSDYSSPEGRVDDSRTRMTSGSAGLGWFGDGTFFNLGYSFNRGRLGIPFAGAFHHHDDDEEESAGAEEADHTARVDETFTWQNVRLNTGVSGRQSFIEDVHVAASFTRWMHSEREDDQIATAFDNKLVNVRTTFKQRPTGHFIGTSGFQLFHRDYKAEGEEALSPPATGNGAALFTLQEVALKHARLQFGGRFDYSGYDPEGLRQRSFAGLSGAAGIHIPLWKNGAFVSNYTHSYRAPAIEELYNYGPHIGNLAFEVGNPNLRRELDDGFDFSVRHQSTRISAEANFFYYRIRDFVYMNFTGAEEHGLRVAEFSQADSRFEGGEVELGFALLPDLWIKSALDTVQATLSATGEPLPRIPPLRSRLGIDARFKGFSFRPELIMAADQNRLHSIETRTPGYTVINLAASYILVGSTMMHAFSVNVFNAGDTLYRNHLSFIKDLAPEMGRGVRVTYSLRFF
jgi:iron complex outermembrane recepter protein